MPAWARIQESFDAPADRLFPLVSDAEGLSRWLGTPARVIAGPRKVSLGTVRRVEVGALRIDEEVLACDPPRRIAYRIVRGLPLLTHHFAEVLVEQNGALTSLEWTARFEARGPGLSALLARTFEVGLTYALPRLHAVL